MIRCVQMRSIYRQKREVCNAHARRPCQLQLLRNECDSWTRSLANFNKKFTTCPNFTSRLGRKVQDYRHVVLIPLQSSAITYFRRDNEFSPAKDLSNKSGITRVIARLVKTTHMTGNAIYYFIIYYVFLNHMRI